MKVKIPGRGQIPECELFIEIMQQGSKNIPSLGNERPVMFMLPGGPGGNHSVYDAIKTSLFNYADLVLIDPRGCGLSSRSEARFCTMESSVEDIEALRCLLEIDSFVLFGGSYGAMVSLSYAVAYSANLSGLILVAGAPSGECYATALETLKKIGTDKQVALTEKLFDGRIESLEEQQKYYSLMQNIYLAKKGETVKSAHIPTVGKKIPYFLELTNFGHTTILPNFNVVDDLHKISTPTLLLAGQHDWINDVKYAYQMNKLIPDSQLVIFPEAGHFVWKDIEELFFAKIENFFLDSICQYCPMIRSRL